MLGGGAEEEEERVLGDLLGEMAKPMVQPRQPLQELSLYMETPAAAAQQLPARDNSDILLFFKFYDHQKPELRVGAVPCRLLLHFQQ